MRDQIPALLSTEHSQVREVVGDYKECGQESDKNLTPPEDAPIRQSYEQPLVLPHSMHR